MIYLTLFLEFFKIGLFTFGGGYAMLPLIEETVLKHSWITENQFLNLIGVCESTPGPIAVNMATFIGSGTGGFLGALCATIGVVLPSFIIILLIATIFKKLLQNNYVKSFLNGVKPVVIALIIFSGLFVGLKVLNIESLTFSQINIVSVITFAIISAVYFIFKFVFKKKFNSILLIGFSAIVSLVLSIII